MRRAVLVAAIACLLGCADYRQKPTFPANAAHRPVLNEQALIGLSPAGNALAAQLVDADGVPPQLRLIIFDARGGPTSQVLEARPEIAQSVAARLLAEGERPLPVLEELVRAQWGQAAVKARELGFVQARPALPEPGSARFAVTGAAANGALPLIVSEREVDGPPRALALFLGEKAGGAEVELVRMPLSGRPVAPQLYLADGTVWLLSGSFREGEPLHRTVGLRRARLGRGEAELHNLHGLTDYAAGDLDAARREFGRAIAADPGFVDPLYNAATTAALCDDDEAALALLKRAAAADPARVQVLGRDDEDLRDLRRRRDVRELLGTRRTPPENVPPPP
jgi:hypothetical protein